MRSKSKYLHWYQFQNSYIDWALFLSILCLHLNRVFIPCVNLRLSALTGHIVATVDVSYGYLVSLQC